MLVTAFEIMKMIIAKLFQMMDSVELLPNITLANMFVATILLSFVTKAIKMLFSMEGSDKK